jgi:hypothetical protein
MDQESPKDSSVEYSESDEIIGMCVEEALRENDFSEDLDNLAFMHLLNKGVDLPKRLWRVMERAETWNDDCISVKRKKIKATV